MARSMSAMGVPSSATNTTGRSACTQPSRPAGNLGAPARPSTASRTTHRPRGGDGRGQALAAYGAGMSGAVSRTVAPALAAGLLGEHGALTVGAVLVEGYVVA